MISFLLGSGFSYDEGIPGLKKINETFVNTKADDIFLGSDQTAFYLEKGQKDPNGCFPENVKDRTFFEKFINFYIDEVVKGKERFNYEEFIDYFYLPRKPKEYPNELKSFCETFRKKYYSKSSLGDDDTNLLFRFYNIYAQLLAKQLSFPKYHEDADYSGYYNYNSFIGFVAGLLKNNNEVRVHTLNHDLFFDFLGSKLSGLWPYYCDGYEENNSQYFGVLRTKILNVTKSYKVRLRYYTGNYNNKLCLYKLHGSIDTYVFNLSSENTDMTRIKTMLGVEEFYKEVKNEQTGEFEYTSGHQYKYPDFLCGTSYKLLFYSDEYYKRLHDHFINNLKKSEKLIVIGFGFKDLKINEMIEESFLKEGKKMIVIDPFPNIHVFKKSYNIQYIEKGINNVNQKEWQSF